MINEQIQHELKTNKKRIEMELKNIREALSDIEAMLANDSFGGSRLSTWTDGYVGRDVNKLSTLLMRQTTLLETLAIMEE
jgi:hypothetical protein